ncbi:MAG: alginate export family protein [Sphingobacteriales bacterium]|nr:alginate export family protein [Sphingobacteriales bacterium]
MKQKVLIILGIIFLSIGFSYGQKDSIKVKFDLSVRYRFELWDGMNAKNYGDNSINAIGKLDDKLLYQRIIPGVTVDFTKKITAAAHLQDSRAFGWSLRNSEYPDLFKVKKAGTTTPYYKMNPGEEFFEIYDLFIEYRKILPNTTSKLGRQKIFYGDHHIFGPGDWGNTGRWTWDALKISWKKDKKTLDIFAGGTKIHDPEKLSLPFTQTEFWGGGIYGHFPIKKLLYFEPFYALKTQGSADYIKDQDIFRNWLGFRAVNPDSSALIWDFTLAKAFGNDNGKTIDAYGLFAKLGYQFHDLWAKPIISIRESYASGGKKTDSKIRTFEPAFGASDKYYGWMNIMQWSNLDDREFVLELFPVKKMWVEIKYNWFYIPVPDDVKVLNTMILQDGKHHLGDEFNTFIRWQAFKHWQFVAVFGYFWPKEIKNINNKPPENASWMALQLLFTI